MVNHHWAGKDVADHERAAAWLNELESAGTYGQAGMYCLGAPFYGAAQLTLVSGRSYIIRFIPPRDMTVVSMSFAVSTAANNDDACDIGLYDQNYAKIVTAGATNGLLNSTGVKVVALGARLNVGTTYYAAFSAGTVGGTAAILSGVSTTGNFIADLFGNTAGIKENSFQAVNPLPSTFVPAGSIAGIPLMAVRES